MLLLFLASPVRLAGKTAIACGLGQRLAAAGRKVALLRLTGDVDAPTDAALFAALPFNSQHRGDPLELVVVLETAQGVEVALIEAPAGDLVEGSLPPGAVRVLVVPAMAPGELVQLCGEPELSLAGIIVNRVPQRRREWLQAAYEAAGLRPWAFLPEDRTLAAPTLGQVTEAIQAQASFLNARWEHPLERPLVASISADPGQGYFALHRPDAVIVRGDKPDLQLAALNAGASCLVLTGGAPPLSYVLDRAEGDEVCVLRTDLGTVATVQRIEAMFGALPFAGGEAKLHRIGELLEGVELAALRRGTAAEIK